MSKSRAIKARRKIKAHLRRRGSDCNFDITPSYVLYWWHWLNKAIFDEQLTPPNFIDVKDLDKDGYHAMCIAKWEYSKKSPVILEINDYFEDKFFFITILAHEMVHQWEQKTYARMSHGSHFFQWKEKFNNLKIPLDKCY